MQEYDTLEDTFKTVYLFKIVVRTKMKCWVVRKRFSHFEKIWLEVEAEVIEADSFGKVIFPSKNLTSFGFLDATGLAQRTRDLQSFMTSLLQVPFHQSSQRQIMHFLADGATDRTDRTTIPADTVASIAITDGGEARMGERGRNTNATEDVRSEGQEERKEDEPTAVPPTTVPPTTVPPTSVPPTSVPPTSVPPMSVPPTSVPPTDDAEGHLNRSLRGDSDGHKQEEERFETAQHTKYGAGGEEEQEQEQEGEGDEYEYLNGMGRRFTSFFTEDDTITSFFTEGTAADDINAGDHGALHAPPQTQTTGAVGSPEGMRVASTDEEDDFSLDVLSRRLSDFASIMVDDGSDEANETRWGLLIDCTINRLYPNELRWRLTLSLTLSLIHSVTLSLSYSSLYTYHLTLSLLFSVCSTRYLGLCWTRWRRGRRERRGKRRAVSVQRIVRWRMGTTDRVAGIKHAG
jgi:hypothetical protein